VALVSLLALAVPVAAVHAAEAVRASLSDLRPSASTVEGTLIIRGNKTLVVDPKSVTATIGGESVPVTVKPAAAKPRSTMLVIDTSGSMGSSGMTTVRAAVKDFLRALPKDVKVGVVSFASTSGVDVKPTTDRAAVQRAVDGLRSKGETALYEGVQDAVKGLGTVGERSIILLSDGGDTVENQKGGDAREAAQLKAAVAALTNGKVRAEVVAFKSEESNGEVLQQFATAGGGSVATAGNREAVAAAFDDAARTLESQVSFSARRPAGVTGVKPIEIKGVASGSPFTATAPLDLGATAPIVASTDDESVAPVPPPGRALTPLTTTVSGVFLPLAVLALFLGVFLLVVVAFAPVFRSERKERIATIEAYGLGRARPEGKAAKAAPSAISQSIVDMGEQFMSGRESTSRTMMLLDRADLPWRAGEWFVLRVLAVLVGGLVGYVLLVARNPWIGLTVGVVAGLVLPAIVLRYLARKRARAFEFVLPDVLMLTATSLASGFSLLQALDAVARDAPEPCAKEFSRALAETRIGADVSDALEHMADRMDSNNMRWATMAIRIQREVGGNLAETLRMTAATLREREGLRRHVRALSAEGRLSAYILIALPIGILFFSMYSNYEYVSLLWTTFYGLVMCFMGIVAMIIGIFWMRNVVKIEV
jgi:tight adherence protein B